MKLVIYETTHHETLPAILDLSDIYFEKTTVFLKELTYQNISGNAKPEEKWRRAIFIRQQEKESNRAFIKMAILFAKKNNCSHFHLSTLDNNLLYFAFHLLALSKAHISLSVQAINEYKVYKYSGIRDISESIAKIFFHKRIRHYRVFFPLMASVLEKEIPGTKAVFIPSRFFSGNKKKSTNDNSIFKIVIPGSVDPNRRNYDFVLDFFKKYLSGFIQKKKLELIILGRNNTNYGTDFIKELQKLSSEHFVIKSYHEYISQTEYEMQLDRADIIWSPIRIDTIGIRGTSEKYGLSTATGLTADLLMNCKPAFIPQEFNIPDHYKEALIPYRSAAELAELMNRSMDGYSEDTYEKIFQSFSYFNKENFKQEMEKLMGIGN
jgi:hypothetical protein